MKCSPLLLAFVLGSASASGHISKTCNTPGQVTLLVDGLTKDVAPKLFERLHVNGISALVSVSSSLLAGADNIAMINNAIKSGHELAYRVDLDKEGLAEATEGNLVADIKRANLRIQELYKTVVKFVTFPYAPEKESTFAAAAKTAGLVPVGHNIYLGPDEEQAMKNIKGDIFDAKHNSYIALIQGDKLHEETLKSYMAKAIGYGFQVVTASQCLAGEPAKALHHVATAFAEPKKFNARQAHHGRRRHKKGKNKMHKKAPLVNPRFIVGYKEPTAKADKKHNGAVDPLKPVSFPKMEANTPKDFAPNELKPVQVDGVKAQDKKAGEEGADKKAAADKAKVDGKANSAAKLLTGSCSLVVVVAALMVLF